MFRTMLVISSFMLSSSALAMTFNGMVEAPSVFGLSVGSTWVRGNDLQTINLEETVQKTYTANHGSAAFPNLELFIGWQKLLAIKTMDRPLISQIGLSVVAGGNAKLEGDIWEDADPEFNNFNYQYKVRHAHVALKGRLIADNCLSLKPYLSGSVGVGFNRAYDFTITPKIPEEVAAPPFKSHSNSTFIYTIGFGVENMFTPNFTAALGYEFGNWGKVKLSPANGQETNQTPTIDHLYAHQIQLSLFYLV